jgi:protein O-mannosyl-transferase
MSKKKSSQSQKSSIDSTSKDTPKIKEPKETKLEYNPFLLFGIVSVLIFISYFRIWENGFIWDDDPYITLNNNVKTFNLKELLTGFAVGNYHPLTMLSLAIEYAIVGEKAWFFHLNNLIFHSINSFLVYRLLNLLKFDFYVSFFTAVLFAIHPLHVESVAWAAERKDVLYTLFLLLSFIYYIKFTFSNKQILYVVSLILFVLSCLSKGMAVVLPALLIATDLWVLKKPLNFKTLGNKIPYFFVTLLFSYIATTAQKEAGADASAVIKAAYNVGERFQIVCYSFLFYWIKTILPLNLLPFYPYPVKALDGSIPGIFSLAVVGMLLFIGLGYWLGRKQKLFWWAIAFFLISISTVLQILPVGSAIVADRYYYLSSIGPLFLISFGLNSFIKTKNTKIIGFGIITLVLMGLTVPQVSTWKNGLTLFKPAEKFYPEDAMVLSNLGWHYLGEKDFPTAKNYLMRADNNGFKNADVCRTIGSMFMDEGDLNKAEIYLTRAYEFKPVVNRTDWLMSLLYQKKGEYQKAVNYIEKGIKNEPDNTDFLITYGSLMTEVGRFEDAKNAYQKLISQNPENWDAHLNHSFVFRKEKQLVKEIELLKSLLEKNPEYLPAYRNIGVSLSELKQFDKAIEYWTKACQYDNTGDFEFNIGVNYALQGKTLTAIDWYKKAAKKGKLEAQEYLKSIGVSY